MCMSKRTVLTALAGLAVSAGFAATAAPASAAAGDCPVNRLCLWFNSDFAGARSDLGITDGSLANELFNDGPSGRNGWGVQVENNAASVYNNTTQGAYIYDGRNCSGTEAFVAGHSGRTLGALKNRVSSVWINAANTNFTCANVNSNGY